MSRLPGKKFRVESFRVNGQLLTRDLRILEDGEFYIQVSAECVVQSKSLPEVQARVQALLEETERIDFDPFISMDYDEAARERWRQDDGVERLSIGMTAGWLSRGIVERVRKIRARDPDSDRDVRLWVEAPVGKDGEVRPLDDAAQQRGRRLSGAATRDFVPFTTERWRRLLAIRDAVKTMRGKLAEILDDKSGGRLDEAPLSRLLIAASDDLTPKGKKKS